MSWPVTTGWVAHAVRLLPLPSWVVKASFVAAHAAMVKLALVADVRPVAAAVRV